MKDPVHSGSTDAVLPGDLAEGLPATAVPAMASRSRSSAGRPMCRPSRRARRMPARTRSTIRLRSSSAIAPMMTTMARPSGPPVSICSRKLTNSMFEPVQLVQHFEEVPG